MRKIWANLQRIIELFTQKIVIRLSKIWIWDSEKTYSGYWIPDLGVKKAPDPRSGSAALQNIDNPTAQSPLSQGIFLSLSLFANFPQTKDQQNHSNCCSVSFH
jgi:hypothetical protein